MRWMISTSLACILTLSAAAVSAQPRTAGSEADDARTEEATYAQADTASQADPVTDPWLLESWGFAPDATNVYASPQVQAELIRIAMGSAEAEAARRSELAAQAASEAEVRSPFGGTVGHTATDPAAFQPVRSTTEHQIDVAGDGRYCTNGFPWFEGVFEGLPHGARLTTFQFWTFDTSSEDIPGFVLRRCNQNAGGPQLSILATYASVGSGGFDTAIVNVDPDFDDIDGRSTYSVLYRLDGQESAVCSEGDNLRIEGARVRWIRQVSPAPENATFDDVPTTHPFFQHIEALAASGITSGCDADSYCPDGPLTRGQMAVFLARGLGLNWN